MNKLNKMLGLIDDRPKKKNVVNPEEEPNLNKLKAFLNEEYSAKGRKFWSQQELFWNFINLKNNKII